MITGMIIFEAVASAVIAIGSISIAVVAVACLDNER